MLVSTGGNFIFSVVAWTEERFEPDVLFKKNIPNNKKQPKNPPSKNLHTSLKSQDEVVNSS